MTATMELVVEGAECSVVIEDGNVKAPPSGERKGKAANP